MWLVYVLIFVFGLTILECVSDLIHFEKWLLDNDNLLNSEGEEKNGRCN